MAIFYFYSDSATFGTGSGRWYVDNIPFHLLHSLGGAYQFVSAGYQKLNGAIYNADGQPGAGGRWQSNNVNSNDTLSLHSIIGKEQLGIY